MTLASVFQALEAAQLSTVIRENTGIFPLFESIHVLAISLVFGFIAMVDFRRVGISMMERTVTRLMSQLLPLAWGAFAVALVSGAALFGSNAAAYADNMYFRIKLISIAAAGINMLVFHAIGCRDIALWDDSSQTPRRARVAGLVSLFIWTIVVGCGCWIGFTMGGPSFQTQAAVRVCVQGEADRISPTDRLCGE